MDIRSVGVYLIMKRIKDFCIDSFSDRLFLQKVIYLLQLFGIDFRLRYDWYLRGPYSKELTSLAYEIDSRKNEYLEMTKNAELRDDVLERIVKLENVLQKRPQSLDGARWLELLSSIHYLKHISSSNPASVTSDNIEEILKKAGKSNYNSEEIESAWEQLNNLGLIGKIRLNKISKRYNPEND
nr:hypothetical protein [candidate division Zixibacteria bacterium]